MIREEGRKAKKFRRLGRDYHAGDIELLQKHLDAAQKELFDTKRIFDDLLEDWDALKYVEEALELIDRAFLVIDNESNQL